MNETSSVKKINYFDYRSRYLSIGKDYSVEWSDEKKDLKPGLWFKMIDQGTYSVSTSYGNSWLMYKIVPINKNGQESKLKLSGYYYLVGFYHHAYINFYRDTSYAIVEYSLSGERFKIPSLIIFHFDIENIQRKLRVATIEKFLSGTNSALKENIPQKIYQLQSFFNRNLNPNKLLNEKKIELIEKHILCKQKRSHVKISAEGNREIHIHW